MGGGQAGVHGHGTDWQLDVRLLSLFTDPREGLFHGRQAAHVRPLRVSPETVEA
jgi:hypothetical protein